MTSVLWFQAGACNGNTMSFINAALAEVLAVRTSQVIQQQQIYS